MELKEHIRSLALAAGFIRPRFLAPFEAPPPVPPGYPREAPALLVTALVYGNCFDQAPGPGASIAPFARRNYYREAVKRLQGLSRQLRSCFGGQRAAFRILCNSPIPEKPLAAASGLGCPGRNGLILTREAGSLFIIAAMTLPYALRGDGPEEGGFPLCEGCQPDRPPCAAACPAGALPGDGTLDRSRCIQWYASGHGGEVPRETARVWGRRLYGCTECQDACILNRRPIRGAETAEGILPPRLDAEELLLMDDGELRARFKGTALGLSWLGPEKLRRNAQLALNACGGALRSQGRSPCDLILENPGGSPLLN